MSFETSPPNFIPSPSSLLLPNHLPSPPLPSVSIMKNRETGEPRGFGFVCFTDEATLNAVCDTTHEVDQKRIDVKRAVSKDRAPPSIRGPQEGSGGAPEGGSPSFARGVEYKVFVGGIAYEVEEKVLRAYFEQYGELAECTIMTEPGSQMSRGFGFVKFKTEEGMNKACQNNNQQHFFYNKRMEVRVATARAGNAKFGGPPVPARGVPPAVPTGENLHFFQLAQAFGRSGWKAGFGTYAFGSQGWKVPKWEDCDSYTIDGPSGFSFKKSFLGAGAAQPAGVVGGGGGSKRAPTPTNLDNDNSNDKRQKV